MQRLRRPTNKHDLAFVQNAIHRQLRCGVRACDPLDALNQNNCERKKRESKKVDDHGRTWKWTCTT